MKSNEFLIERVINLHTPAQKQQFVGVVWDLMQKSYASVPGGFGSAASPEELIAKTGLWKLVRRGDVITAANLYRDQYGRKTIASGTDGTRQGVKDYKLMKDEDVKFSRSWAEVSGAPEHLMKKAKCVPIPAKFAPLLTRKHILSYNEDGVHYSRMIAGDVHEKIIYGSVTLSADDLALLQQHGIQMHELPNNFKFA